MNLPEATLEMTSGAFTRSDEADRRLLVQFMLFPHLNQGKSNTEGRPIYDDREYVMIIVPGDKDNIVHRPASERDKARFSRQYQAFLNKQSQVAASGTPLKLVPWLTAGQVKELEYFNCYTLEQLSEMPDAHTNRFMGLIKLKQLAKDAVAAAKESSHVTQMRAALDERDQQLQALNEMVTKMSKKIDQLQAASEAEA